MGFDLDRFIGPVNDGLLCCICRDVLEDPVQAPCEHAYCRFCIEGWLVHETSCPEDRRSMSMSDLKPLFRYMKNDLERLQIRCINKNLGCSHVCTLEVLETHESECSFAMMACPNELCTETFLMKDLDDHLKSCQFRSKECPKGCGMLMVTADDKNHNCVAELRTAMDVLRSEMTCKIDDLKKEMELRLNMQRGHMVQKETSMQFQIDEMKSDISKLSQKIQLLMDLEVQRKQDIEKLQLEKRELMELLKGNQTTVAGSRSKGLPGTCRSYPAAFRGKVTTL